MIVYSTQEVFVHDLSAEGAQLAERGSHEARVWNALPMKGEGKGLTIPQLKSVVGDESAKIGQGRAFKNGWIGKEGDTLVRLVSSHAYSLLFCRWRNAKHSRFGVAFIGRKRK